MTAAGIDRAPGAPAALPSAARHTWLVSHLAALRAGRMHPERDSVIAAGIDRASGAPAALPSAARHAWLVSHLAALRAGRIALSEIP